MFKYFICFLILINTTQVFANYYNNYSNSNFSSKLKMNQPKTIIAGSSNRRQIPHFHPQYCPQCNINNPYLLNKDLNTLEKYALNKTYQRENSLQRLERLENLAFGATQYGDIQSRYQNVENAILSRPKYGTKNSILKNLATYFSGQTTGFTPNLIPYSTFNNLGGFSSNPYLFTPNNGYRNNSLEQYSNGIFGGGWGNSFNNYGTGSSIKILD